MEEDTVECNKDINVEEIMAKIRENIRRRQEAGELPPYPDFVIGSPSKNCYSGQSEDLMQRDLSITNSGWDIRNNSYYISSHHPYIGKFLVRGRQIVHAEVRRYVDPTIFRQTEFNASTSRIITRVSQQIADLNRSHQDLNAAFSLYKRESDKKIIDCITTVKDELDSKIELTTKEYAKVKNDLNLKIEQTLTGLLSQVDRDIHFRASIAHVLEDRFEKGQVQKSAPLGSTSKEAIPYFLFEERFRGSREDIKHRQQAFLPFFEKCSRVLDIGCGRGEFLEILREHDIGGVGVDNDPDMAAYCRSRQLEVENFDAITYLRSIEDKSLDGIFIDQVVEHLEPDYLIGLLGLCHQKMKFGYYIVVETVNPLSFVSFVNFYIDMTHKRPVHPETLHYLLSASGFRECEKKFFSPVPDDRRLKRIDMTADLDETESKYADVYNHNVDMLNAVLFGAQDYAVVGKK